MAINCAFEFLLYLFKFLYLSDQYQFLKFGLQTLFVLFNSFASHASFIDRARSTAEKFHIFGSVHAMKTEIPPFDSEIKDLTNSSL